MGLLFSVGLVWLLSLFPSLIRVFCARSLLHYTHTLDIVLSVCVLDSKNGDGIMDWLCFMYLDSPLSRVLHSSFPPFTLATAAGVE